MDEQIDDPTEAIKKIWTTLPDGYYIAELRCGSAFLCNIQKILGGSYGSVLINGYAALSPYIMKMISNNWTVLNRSTLEAYFKVNNGNEANFCDGFSFAEGNGAFYINFRGSNIPITRYEFADGQRNRLFYIDKDGFHRPD